MKISEQDKAKTQTKLLHACVDVVTEKGFKSATMREIARHAGVGDATIYNYFPAKEHLLYDYCEYLQQQVMDSLREIGDFHDYSLREQLQQLMETQLQQWLPAREFLREVFRLTYYAPVAGASHLEKTRTIFNCIVTDLLEAAIEAEEIPEQPYQDLLPRLLWDYQSGVLAYWLNDDSEGFANTTQLVDKSMDIIGIVLQQGVLGKTFDLVSFLFRTHVLANLGDMMTAPAALSSGPKTTKRPFMGKTDES